MAEGYVDQVGSLNAKQIGDASLKDVTNYIKNEIDTHEQTLADKTDNNAETTQKDRCKYYAYFAKECTTGILLPLLDMGTDVASAVTHFYFENYAWGILTLVFIALPGLVCGIIITIKGLTKECSAQRIVNFSIILVALPFLYPFVQIFVNSYMVYLMFQQKSHHV